MLNRSAMALTLSVLCCVFCFSLRFARMISSRSERRKLIYIFYETSDAMHPATVQQLVLHSAICTALLSDLAILICSSYSVSVSSSISLRCCCCCRCSCWPLCSTVCIRMIKLLPFNFFAVLLASYYSLCTLCCIL